MKLSETMKTALYDKMWRDYHMYAYDSRKLGIGSKHQYRETYDDTKKGTLAALEKRELIEPGWGYSNPGDIWNRHYTLTPLGVGVAMDIVEEVADNINRAKTARKRNEDIKAVFEAELVALVKSQFGRTGLKFEVETKRDHGAEGMPLVVKHISIIYPKAGHLYCVGIYNKGSISFPHDTVRGDTAKVISGMILLAVEIADSDVWKRQQ